MKKKKTNLKLKVKNEFKFIKCWFNCKLLTINYKKTYLFLVSEKDTYIGRGFSRMKLVNLTL